MVLCVNFTTTFNLFFQHTDSLAESVCLVNEFMSCTSQKSNMLMLPNDACVKSTMTTILYQLAVSAFKLNRLMRQDDIWKNEKFLQTTATNSNPHWESNQNILGSSPPQIFHLSNPLAFTLRNFPSHHHKSAIIHNCRQHISFAYPSKRS